MSCRACKDAGDHLSLQYLPVKSDLLLLSIHETPKLANLFFPVGPLGPLSGLHSPAMGECSPP